jgi:predicted small metal-binding protein
MKTISCREAGFECDYIVKCETEEDAIRNGAEHAINEHGMKPEHITPETKEKIRALVRDV